MTKQTPLLAAKYDAKKQRFPCLASPKIDGFRCIAREGKALTRTLKPHQNLHLQEQFAKYPDILEGMDGELVVGKPHNVITKEDLCLVEVEKVDEVFERTSGALRRHTGTPDFSFYVFDLMLPGVPFAERYAELEKRMKDAPAWVHLVPQVTINSAEEAQRFYEQEMEKGYEGIMLRSADGMYKHGRATVNEGILNKMKERVDNEARVIGFHEEMQNNNEQVLSETGHLKRSSHAANKTGKGRLGSFIAVVVNGPQKGETFRCGSGMTEEQRIDFWERRSELLGKFFTFEHLLCGAKTAPRHPVFKHFRPDWDLSED